MESKEQVRLLVQEGKRVEHKEYESLEELLVTLTYPKCVYDIRLQIHQSVRTVVFISLSDGTSIPRIVLHRSIQKLKEVSSCLYRLWEVICVERDVKFHALSKYIVVSEVPDAQPLLIKPVYINELQQAIDETRKLSLPSNAVVIIFLGTDCSQMSKANKANTQVTRRGMHLAPNNSTWYAEQRISSVAGRVAANKLIVLQEMVVAANPLDEQELDAHFGPGITVRSDCYGQYVGSNRDRKFRASPRPQDPFLHGAHVHVQRELYHEPLESPKPFPEEVIWPIGGNNIKLTLRAYIVKLVRRSEELGLTARDWTNHNMKLVLETRHVLRYTLMQGVGRDNGKLSYSSDFEIQTMKALVCIDAEGQHKYAGVKMWASWMGLNAKKWKFYSCNLHVTSYTFPVAGPNKSGMLQVVQSDCGSIQYCKKCSVILEALGKAWHTRCAEVVASAQLQEAELKLRVTSTATAWPMSEEVHICNETVQKMDTTSSLGEPNVSGNLNTQLSANCIFVVIITQLAPATALQLERTGI